MSSANDKGVRPFVFEQSFDMLLNEDEVALKKEEEEEEVPTFSEEELQAAREAAYQEGMQAGLQNAAVLAVPVPLLRLQHHRTGAIAKQHACGPVFPIEDARKSFCPDHQDAVTRPRFNEVVSDRHCIDESRAYRVHVEGSASMHAAQNEWPQLGRISGWRMTPRQMGQPMALRLIGDCWTVLCIHVFDELL